MDFIGLLLQVLAIITLPDVDSHRHPMGPTGGYDREVHGLQVISRHWAD
jgi:hypothetical protein